MKNILYFLVSTVSIEVVFGKFKMPQCWKRPPQLESPPCKIKIVKYYYDIRKNECIFFEIGDCQTEPENSFNNKLECEVFCGIQVMATVPVSDKARIRLRVEKHMTPKVEKKERIKAPQCWKQPQLKKSTCKIKFERYYYDKSTNQCKFFERGECEREPENSFNYKLECEIFCGIRAIVSGSEISRNQMKRPSVKNESRKQNIVNKPRSKIPKFENYKMPNEKSGWKRPPQCRSHQIVRKCKNPVPGKFWYWGERDDCFELTEFCAINTHVFHSKKECLRTCIQPGESKEAEIKKPDDVYKLIPINNRPKKSKIMDHATPSWNKNKIPKPGPKKPPPCYVEGVTMKCNNPFPGRYWYWAERNVCMDTTRYCPIPGYTFKSKEACFRTCIRPWVRRPRL